MFLLSFENLIYFDHINLLPQFLPPTYPPNFMFSLSLPPFLSLPAPIFSLSNLQSLVRVGWLLLVLGPALEVVDLSGVLPLKKLTLPLPEAIRFQQPLSLDGTSCTPPGWILSGVSLHRSCTCCQNLWVHMCNCPVLSRRSFLEDTTTSGSYSFCPPSMKILRSWGERYNMNMPFSAEDS